MSGVNGGTGLCLRYERRRESPEDVGGMVVTENRVTGGAGSGEARGAAHKGPATANISSILFLIHRMGLHCEKCHHFYAIMHSIRLFCFLKRKRS